MANKGQIRFGIGFDVDKSGLDQLKTSLYSLQKLKSADLTVNTENAIQQLEKVETIAGKVSNALANSFNTQLGTYNIQQFRQELEKSQLTLAQIQKAFSTVGAKGTLAFRQLTSVLTENQLKLKETHNILQSMSQTLMNTVKWSIASTAVNSLTSSIQKAWSFTKQLDTSLNNIMVVTGKSSEEMEAFAVRANKAAKALGASTKSYADASLIYYQQGLSDTDVAARTDVTMKVANVTGQNASAVSEQLTAVWNGYKVSSAEAELYIDKLSAVAATTAADLEELSTGMSKVASAANIMGVDIDQLNAQLATIVSVTREAPESIGTALKTVYARMSDIKAGLDEETTLDEYTEQMAQMGINVLDAQNNLRDMGEVVEEIGKNWDNLSRSQQVSLAQTIAGTRQYSRMMALFDNWGMYEKAKSTSASSAGTLDEQNEVKLESLEAKMQQLATTAEKLYLSLFDSDSFKTLIDGASKLLDVVNLIVNAMGGGGTVLLTIVGIMLRAKSIGTTMSAGISAWITNLRNAKENATALKNEMSLLVEIGQIDLINDQALANIIKAKENLNILAQQGIISAETYNKLNEELNTLAKTSEQILINEATAQQFDTQLQSDKINTGVFDEKSNRVRNPVNGQFKKSQPIMTIEQVSQEMEQKIEQNPSISSEELLQSNESLKVLKVQLDEIRTTIEAAFTQADESALAYIAKVEKAANATAFLGEEEKKQLLDTAEVAREKQQRLLEALEREQKATKVLEQEKTKLVTLEKELQKIKEQGGDTQGLEDKIDEQKARVMAAEKEKRSASSSASKRKKSADNALSKLADESQKSGKKITKTLAAVEDSAEDAAKGINKSLDQKATKSFKSLSKEIDKAKLTQKIDSITKALGTIASAIAGIQMMSNAISVFGDDSLTAGEKFAQGIPMVISSLLTMLPALKGTLTLMQSISAATDIFNLKQAATTGLVLTGTAAEELLAKAKGKVADKTWEAAKAELARTGALSADTVSTLANATAQKSLLGSVISVTAGIIAKTAALFGLQMAIVPVWLVVLVLIAALAALAAIVVGIVAGIKALSDAYNADAIAAEQAAESAKRLAKAYEDTKAAYEDLKKSISDYRDAKKAIEEMTAGTTEWKEAIEAANEKARELIASNPELKYSIGEGGLIEISDESLRELEQNKLKEVRSAQNDSLSAQQNLRNKEIRAEKTRLDREGVDWDDVEIGEIDPEFAKEINALKKAIEENNKLTAQENKIIAENNFLNQGYSQNEAALYSGIISGRIDAEAQKAEIDRRSERIEDDLDEDSKDFKDWAAKHNYDLEDVEFDGDSVNILDEEGEVKETIALASIADEIAAAEYQAKQTSLGAILEAKRIYEQVTENASEAAKELFARVLSGNAAAAIKENTKYTLDTINEIIKQAEDYSNGLSELQRENLKETAANMRSAYENIEQQYNFTEGTQQAVQEILGKDNWTEVMSTVSQDISAAIGHLYSTIAGSASKAAKEKLTIYLSDFSAEELVQLSDSLDFTSQTLSDDFIQSLKDLNKEIDYSDQGFVSTIYLLDKMNGKLFASKEAYGEILDIVDALVENANDLSTDDYQQLVDQYGSRIQDYFLQMEDGTYSLTMAAEAFRQEVQKIERQKLESALDEVLEKAENLNKTIPTTENVFGKIGLEQKEINIADNQYSDIYTSSWGGLTYKELKDAAKGIGLSDDDDWRAKLFSSYLGMGRVVGDAKANERRKRLESGGYSNVALAKSDIFNEGSDATKLYIDYDMTLGEGEVVYNTKDIARQTVAWMEQAAMEAAGKRYKKSDAIIQLQELLASDIINQNQYDDMLQQINTDPSYLDENGPFKTTVDNILKNIDSKDLQGKNTAEQERIVTSLASMYTDEQWAEFKAENEGKIDADVLAKAEKTRTQSQTRQAEKSFQKEKELFDSQLEYYEKKQSALEELEDAVTGTALIDILEQENELLAIQIQELKEAQKAAKTALSYQFNFKSVEEGGVEWDKESGHFKGGTTSEVNLKEIYKLLNPSVNPEDIAKMSSTDLLSRLSRGEITEITSAADWEQLKSLLNLSSLSEEQRNSVTSMLTSMNTVLEPLLTDYTQQISDKAREAIENNLEKLDVQINAKIEFKDLKADIQDFIQSTVLEEDDFSGITSVLTSGLQDSLNIIPEYVEQYKKYANWNEANIIKTQEDWDDIVKKLEDADWTQEDINEYMSQYILLSEKEAREQEYINGLMEAATEAKEYINELEETHLEAVEKVAEAYDKQREFISNTISLLEYQLELNQLLQGEDNTAVLSDYYDQVIAQKKANYDSLIAERNWLATQMEASNIPEESMRQYRERYEALEQEIASSQVDIANTMQQQMVNSAKVSIDGILGEWQEARDEWEWQKKMSEDYLDDVESFFRIADLESAFTSAISQSTDEKVQARINKLREEELEYLRSKDKLTKTDIERAEKRLSVLQAQIALEEAQENKSKMRLTRGADGRYSYQYVADDSAIQKAQDDLRKANEEAIKVDADAYKENLDKVYNYYQEFVDMMTDALADGRIEDLEEERLNEFVDRIYGIIGDSEELKAKLIETLSQSGFTLEDLGLSGDWDDLFNNFDPEKLKQIISKASQIVDEEGNIIATDLAEYLEKTLGISISDIINDENRTDTSEISKWTEETKAIEGQITAIGGLKDQYHALVNETVTLATAFAEMQAKAAGIEDFDAEEYAAALLSGGTTNDNLPLTNDKEENPSAQGGGADNNPQTDSGSENPQLTPAPETSNESSSSGTSWIHYLAGSGESTLHNDITIISGKIDQILDLIKDLDSLIGSRTTEIINHLVEGITKTEIKADQFESLKSSNSYEIENLEVTLPNIEDIEDAHELVEFFMNDLPGLIEQALNENKKDN